MEANNPLQAAVEWGGFDLNEASFMTAAEVRQYFSQENFSRMFPGDDSTYCGGYSLTACANAVIDELELPEDIAPTK